MTTEGPLLEELTRRLAETPADFLEKPRIGTSGDVVAAAVVADLIRDLGERLPSQQISTFIVSSQAGARRLSLILIATWLLHHPWFALKRVHARKAYELLRDGLDEVSAVVEPSKFVSDPDRREELVRLVLKALDLRPFGESEAQATDRLTTLDSIARQRLIRDSRKAQERIREVQEAMKKKAAEEAAASYGRE